MSTLLCSNGSVVVTSGLKFKVLQPQFFEDGSNPEGIERELPEVLPPAKTSDENEEDVKEKQKPDEAPRTILGGSISSDGHLMALCDDRKQLTLWKCEDWSLVHQWTIQRRANKVIFNNDSTAIFLADKGGDLFKFDLVDKSSDGVCLLGHLSMLLDLTLSACGKFIITCDRDEKIRVSHYPNAYNIHNFCLGHFEFVSGIALCPHNPSFLCSSSGDGTIRIWDFCRGVELDSKLCSEDVSGYLQSFPETEHSKSVHPHDSSKNGSTAPRVKRSPIPAVKSLRCRKISDDESLILVTIERFEGLLAYIASGPDGKLRFLQKLQTPKPVWDYGYDNASGDLIILLFSSQDYLQRFKVSSDGFTEIPVHSSDRSKSELDRFFEAAKTSPSPNIDDLYKKWFDNVNEYMERKVSRINNKSGKSEIISSEPEPKKLKL